VVARVYVDDRRARAPGRDGLVGDLIMCQRKVGARVGTRKRAGNCCLDDDWVVHLRISPPVTSNEAPVMYFAAL
jgi:hypothetical protein